MKNSESPNPEDLAAIVLGEAGRRSWKRWLWPFLLIAAAVGGWMWWSHSASSRAAAPAFVTEPLRRGNIALTVTATGNLEPTNEVTVGSELSGTTLEVFVDTNDHVTKGQPLAKLDTRKLSEQTESSRAALNAAKAKVAQAEATLLESEATLARKQELHRISGGRTPSASEMNAALAAAQRGRADLDSAKAEVGQSEAQVRINESDLGKAVISSPIDGIVLTRTIEPGQTVAASFTAPELFVIAEKLEHMKLKISIAEADIGRVAKGQKASFTVDAWQDRTYTAKVTKVAFGSAVTDNVVTYETELEVANDDLSLRPGMTATAEVQVAEANGVMVVPTAALRFDPAASSPKAAGGAPKKSFVQNLMPGPPRGGGRPGKPAGDEEKPVVPGKGGTARIWVLKDGKAEPLSVKLGLSDGKFAEVSGNGLTENLPIIVRANTLPPS